MSTLLIRTQYLCMHLYTKLGRCLIKTLCLLMLCLHGQQAAATHIFGADFYYEHISGNTYKVSMAFYGDCSGSAFSSLPGSTPQIELRNGGTLVSQFTLALDSIGKEVTPVCESERTNTKCVNPSNLIPGVTRFIYSTLVTVPGTSANWHFYFNGNMSSSNSAGRSNSITNIVPGAAGSSVMVMDISLNNVNGPNSSPRFTTIPTPFYCVNIAQQYNPGAVDVNNDSLVFVLAPAQEASGSVTYQTGYSATQPLATVPGTFSFNNLTGQLSFTPNNTQLSTVVTRVDEYRNGTLVGSATREMNFVVLANCNGNAPPTGTVDTSISTVGGVFERTTSFNICEGTPYLRFPIRPVDPEGDTINVTLNGLPPGMTSSIINNNTPRPVVVIEWANIGSQAPGNYTFYLTYKDNGCPLSSQQTQAYTVHIIRPNTVTYRTLYPTYCLHKAYVEYQLANGLTPRLVTVKRGTDTVRSFTDQTGTYRDSLAPGTYSVIITSPNLTCSSNISLTVRDSGTFPYPPVIADTFYCLNDPPVALAATTYAGADLYWIDTLSNRFSQAPVPSTARGGIFRWYAVQRYKTCESLPDTGLVYVTKRPVADFVLDPAAACDRDTVQVTFTGSTGVGPIISYEWGWGGANYVAGPQGGPYRAHWPVAGTKTITLRVLENKCPSDSVAKAYLVKPTPIADFTAYNICQYDTMLVTYTAAILSGGQQFAWSFDDPDFVSGSGAGPYRLHWASGGKKDIRLSVSKDGCIDTASRQPAVYGIPEAAILNVPDVHCLGDKIYLEHAGSGATFTWTPRDQVYFDREGRPFIYTLKPTTYTLTVANQEGCIDSAHVTYDRIEPCCNFSYPNAFTPNGDGRNDRFHVVTYGNDAEYSLSIYNRWGQRVFHSGNQKEGWDGIFNGKECEAGTYFYTFKAKCLTGYEESKQGEFTLIR